MTKKQPNDELSKALSADSSQDLSWEESVAHYLKDHPEFFERYRELFASLTLPHPDHGSAISLVERQLQALRSRDTETQRHLRELVDIARENDLLGERLHHFAVAMIDAAALEDVLGTAHDLLRQEFRLDAVAVLLQTDEVDVHNVRAEFVRADDPHFAALWRRCLGKRAVCGVKLDADSMAYLFSGRVADIQSVALIPMKDASTNGLLCLGSRDARRFHPEMGVVYLQRLGELLLRACARYLRSP